MTEFPVDTFKEAAEHLRRPFTPAAVKFKVQATWPKDNPDSALIVSYIDARLVVERFNKVCPHLWADSYSPVDAKTMWCHLTVDGITRSDVGEGDKKGLVSDALKRAAVRFGIGVSLYATTTINLKVSDGHLKKVNTRQGPSLQLTPKGEHRCRAIYAEWLTNHGEQAFGSPLDHGDVDEAVGDHEADDSPEVEPLSEHTAAVERQMRVAANGYTTKRKTLADVLSKTFNSDVDAIVEFVKSETGKGSTKDLTIEEMDKLIREVSQ